MTVLPPGLIIPSDEPRTVVVLERPVLRSGAAPEPRWSIRSIAFVLLVAFTFVVLGVTIADVTNG